MVRVSDALRVAASRSHEYRTAPNAGSETLMSAQASPRARHPAGALGSKHRWRGKQRKSSATAPPGCVGRAPRGELVPTTGRRASRRAKRSRASGRLPRKAPKRSNPRAPSGKPRTLQVRTPVARSAVLHRRGTHPAETGALYRQHTGPDRAALGAARPRSVAVRGASIPAGEGCVTRARRRGTGAPRRPQTKRAMRSPPRAWGARFGCPPRLGARPLKAQFRRALRAWPCSHRDRPRGAGRIVEGATRRETTALPGPDDSRRSRSWQRSARGSAGGRRRSATRSPVCALGAA